MLGDQKDLSIHIRLSKKKKIIEIEDNGIGMSRQELIDNLGTIARSGTNKFIEAMKLKRRMIFLQLVSWSWVYSSYMVAETVDVLSKSAENKETNLWSSNGKDGYSIENQNKKIEEL